MLFLENAILLTGKGKLWYDDSNYLYKMGIEKQEPKNLDTKEVHELFDFSDSQNKSRDIGKEKEGFSVIRGEFGKLSDMKDAKGKMSPESIDHAFFAYTGKELDKLPKGPDKQKAEELRKELLVMLQGVKDPRDKLAAISELKHEWISMTGTASGSVGKKNIDNYIQSQVEGEKQHTELSNKMKEFQEMLRKIETQKKEQANKLRNIAIEDGDKNMGNRNPQIALECSRELSEWPV